MKSKDSDTITKKMKRNEQFRSNLFSTIKNNKNGSMNKEKHEKSLMDLKSMNLRNKQRMCMSDALSNKNSIGHAKESIRTKTDEESSKLKKNLFHSSKSKICVFKSDQNEKVENEEVKESSKSKGNASFKILNKKLKTNRQVENLDGNLKSTNRLIMERNKNKILESKMGIIDEFKCSSEDEPEPDINQLSNQINKIKNSREWHKKPDEIAVVTFHGDSSFITFGRLTAEENEFNEIDKNEIE